MAGGLTQERLRHEPSFAASGQRVWREDLQGLRVVAILLVGVYHVWAGRVSGGVDVFLMLSGFFVGGSLWRRVSTDRPIGMRKYLLRHVRRLVPAAATVLVATAIATVVLLPVTRWADAAGQTLASLLYAENWRLVIAGSQYGAVGADQSPWQHFWSCRCKDSCSLRCRLSW